MSKFKEKFEKYIRVQILWGKLESFSDIIEHDKKLPVKYIGKYYLPMLERKNEITKI